MKRLLRPFKPLFDRQVKLYHKFFHGNCAVLLYHRVTDISTDPQQLAVSPQHFEAQLKILKNNYNLLTIEEFHQYLLNKKKLPVNSVVLTFDDGYADNYLEALPLLEKYNLQALFYIATGTLNTSVEFWWDAIERLILVSKTIPNQQTITIGEKAFKLQLPDDKARWDLYESLLPALRRMTSYDREKQIAILASIFRSETARTTHRAMTFDELKKMHRSSSAVIGAHTHLHPSLGALNYSDQLNEIKTSKLLLEELLHERIKYFSYPFGTNADYNHDTIEICKSLNFDTVAANYPYIAHAQTDLFRIPRFLVRNWDGKTFQAALNNFLN